MLESIKNQVWTFYLVKTSSGVIKVLDCPPKTSDTVLGCFLYGHLSKRTVSKKMYLAILNTSVKKKLCSGEENLICMLQEEFVDIFIGY